MGTIFRKVVELPFRVDLSVYGYLFDGQNLLLRECPNTSGCVSNAFIVYIREQKFCTIDYGLFITLVGNNLHSSSDIMKYKYTKPHEWYCINSGRTFSLYFKYHVCDGINITKTKIYKSSTSTNSFKVGVNGSIGICILNGPFMMFNKTDEPTAALAASAAEVDPPSLRTGADPYGPGDQKATKFHIVDIINERHINEFINANDIILHDEYVFAVYNDYIEIYNVYSPEIISEIYFDDCKRIISCHPFDKFLGVVYEADVIKTIIYEMKESIYRWETKG